MPLVRLWATISSNAVNDKAMKQVLLFLTHVSVKHPRKMKAGTTWFRLDVENVNKESAVPLHLRNLPHTRTKFYSVRCLKFYEFASKMMDVYGRELLQVKSKCCRKLTSSCSTSWRPVRLLVLTLPLRLFMRGTLPTISPSFRWSSGRS